MAFGRRNNAHAAPTTDYGAPAVRSNRLHRPLLALNHAPHLASSLIVLGISAYFIHDYENTTHLRYWVVISSVDALFYLPALVLPAVKRYKGYLAPLAWVLSYLWLTGFIFAVQGYEYNGGCAVNSPRFMNKCSLKRTVVAFTFLAFFTSVVGTLLEARLWDVQRFKHTHVVAADDREKHGVGVGVGGAAPGVDAPVAHQTV